MFCNCIVLLMNIKLYQEDSHSASITSIVSTCSQFNVVSCVLVKCLDEIRHDDVGLCAARSFQTTTLLSITQDIWKQEHELPLYPCRFTVVVTANVVRSLICISVEYSIIATKCISVSSNIMSMVIWTSCHA